MLKHLRYKLLSPFSSKYDVKYRASVEAAEWQAEGYNYRELWRHHSLYIKQTNSIYIAISKSANSCIRRALNGSETFYGAFDSELNKAHGVHQLHKLRKTLSDVIKEQIPCWTVVRHPEHRFWSAYENKIVRHPDYPLAGEIAAFHGQQIKKDTPVSVEMVLDYLEQTPVHLVEEHLRPQWACCGYGRIHFAHIAHVESLEEDLKVAVALNLFPEEANRRIVHSNASKQTIENSEKAQFKDRIETYYQKDYEVFGY